MSSRTFPGSQSSESHPLLWTLYLVKVKRTKTPPPPGPAQCGSNVQDPTLPTSMWPDKETNEPGKTDIPNVVPWSPSLRRAWT